MATKPITSETVKAEIKAEAKQAGTTQYHAAMIEYLEQSLAEGRAKRRKEKLKEILTKYLDRQGVKAVIAPEPMTNGQYPVAFKYNQDQPRADRELAEKILPKEVFDRIFTSETVECFTVRAFEEDTARLRVETSNQPAPSKPSTERDE